jgi:hypothetical protein
LPGAVEPGVVHESAEFLLDGALWPAAAPTRRMPEPGATNGRTAGGLTSKLAKRYRPRTILAALVRVTETATMAELRFDPSQAIECDVGRGRIALEGAPAQPRVLIPAAVLGELTRSLSEQALRDLGRKLGAAAGERVVKRLGEATVAASEQQLAEHLGGELALMGLGSLAVERWGRALVMTLHEPPLDASADQFLGHVIEGALAQAYGREMSAVPLSRDAGRARVAMLSARAAGEVRSWLAGGQTWGQVVERLHAAP